MSDILLLPLGSPDCPGLHIAEQMHRQSARFRSPLFTGSYAARCHSPVPPFDVVVAWRKSCFIQRRRDFEDALRLAASAPTDRTAAVLTSMPRLRASSARDLLLE